MPDTPALTVREHVRRINAAYRKSVEGIIETGEYLLAAKKALNHGEWILAQRDLDFGERQVQMFMRIAKHPALSDPQHITDLPSSWATLYELSVLPAEQVKAGIANGAISSRTTRSDAKVLTGHGQPAPAGKPYPYRRGATLMGNLCRYAEECTPEEMAAEMAGALPPPADLRGLSLWLREVATECAQARDAGEPDGDGVVVRTREYLEETAPGEKDDLASDKAVAELEQLIAETKRRGNDVPPTTAA